MKKLLAAILATFALTANANREIQTMVYSWTVSDTAANFYRALADEANKNQDKYTFIFDAKPGAGGTVAAKYVLRTPNTFWINSSAGFIRPNLFPEDSHSMTDFRSLLPMCEAPVVITSSKYKSWKDVPTDKPLTIGVSGMGTTTHLISLQIVKKYPNMAIVPFKSTSEALISSLSGNTDFAAGFLGDSEQYVNDPNAKRPVYWLGITGKTTVKGAKPLIAQGFVKELGDMSIPQQIFMARSVPEEKFQEIRHILVKAANSKRVRDANAADNCIPNSQMADKDIDPWFEAQFLQWKRLTQGVTVNK